MDVDTLSKQLFFVTARLDVNRAERTSRGSGWFYNCADGEGNERVFLVTARHVIDDATSVAVKVIQRADDGSDRPLIGQVVGLTVTEPAVDFVVPEDDDIDLAVAEVTDAVRVAREADVPMYFRSINRSMTLSHEDESSLDAIEPLTFVGYPAGFYDRVNLTPIARRGFTATPIELDYNGRPQFLIDAAVFPGSSGSPVFLHRIFADTDRSSGTDDFRLIGLVAKVHIHRAKIGDDAHDDPLVVEQVIDLGIVYKARAIVELIDTIIGDDGC